MQPHQIHLPTIMLLIIHLFLVLFSSVAAAQAQYFINCGSSDSTTINDGRTFIGEKKSSNFSFHKGESVRDNNQSASQLQLYKTARVFKKPSVYKFFIQTPGAYYVRFHFYAFSSSLSNAKFKVLASGIILLLDFSPEGNATDLPEIKEFLLEINQTGWFQVFLVPNPSSSAFVNAIEVLPTSSNITEASGSYITPGGSTGNYKGQKPAVLETIYLINVGGQRPLTPSAASLWRTWEQDDQYFMTKGSANNKSSSTGTRTAAGDDTPSDVFASAKSLNSNSTSNLTWQFNLSKSTKYYVRAYFCNIVTSSPGPYTFNLSIYSNFTNIDLSNRVWADPFYVSYIVESGDSDDMNISVRPRHDSGTPIAFLNGIEILQVMDRTAADPKIENAHNLVLIISLVASGLALGAVVVCLSLKRRTKKSSEAFEWGNLPLHGAASSRNRASESTSSHGTTFQNLQLGLKIPFVEIQRVTNNFDVALIIGEGGFGKVYLGTLRSGFKVAVKRGNSDHGQGIAEFQTEIMILSTIRHRHLVSLIGYCCDNGEMILVYEYMANGTLRSHLYESQNSSTSSRQRTLSWKQRLEICLGAAKGIQYLHTGTNKGIIHRDVKSTNILLDENYVAKVADFGLSRSGYLEQTHVSISDVKGTLGYLDPEYITCLQLTEKSDVYSFGVVLLEVLSARSVIDRSLPREQVSLVEWAMACYEEERLEKIIDPSIADEINPNSLKKFYEIAEMCLKRDAEERPPMSDVCWGLEYALQLQKAASERLPMDDSTIDASLNMPLPAVGRFPSQSIVDYDYSVELTDTGTGEVFSQLTVDNSGSGR